MYDLAVIIVSHADGTWLEACLPSVVAAADGLDLELIVVENGGSPVTADLVGELAPMARVIVSANHGFAHGCNEGLGVADARYVLFLNPDTEISRGSLAEMVAYMDRHEEVGLAGCRQTSAAGDLHFTMRRFPTAIRLLAEGLGSERWPLRRSWTGQRHLVAADYDTVFDLDWTTGSFMLVRREALQAAGWFDERLFLYCDDPDLALRIKRGGWRVRHLPEMEIIHHADKMGWSVRGYAQYAYASRIYFTKHFGAVHRRAALTAAALGYVTRALLYPVLKRNEPAAARAMRAALRAVLGLSPPPYEAPPLTAVRSRALIATDESRVALSGAGGPGALQ